MMMMMTTDHLSADSSFMMLEGDPSCVISGSFSCFSSSDEGQHSWMDVTCHIPPLVLKLHLFCPSFTRGTLAPSREKYIKFRSSTCNSLLMLTVLLSALSANSVFIARHILCSRFLSPLLCFLLWPQPVLHPCPDITPALAVISSSPSITFCFGLCVKPTVFMPPSGFVLNNAVYEDCHHHFASLPPRLQQYVCVCWFMHGW